MIRRMLGTLDKFCEGWVVMVALIVAVAVAIRLTHSDLPALALAVPGFYIIARKQGMRGLVKFCLGMLVVAITLAVAVSAIVPCDGWGNGPRLFYRIQCD